MVARLRSLGHIWKWLYQELNVSHHRMKLHAAVVIIKKQLFLELIKPSRLTVSSGRALELSLQGEQSHVPHQSGLRDH